jgi:hypothetical protein
VCVCVCGLWRGVILSCLSNLEILQAAFIPFITAGDPDLETTAKALKFLDSCGSDVIELGVPYSDPLADGPVIQVHVQLYLCLTALVFIMVYKCLLLHNHFRLQHIVRLREALH